MENIEVFVVGNSKKELDRHMKVEGRNILHLAIQSKRIGKIPPEDNEEMRGRYKRARMYLEWMDTSLEMTPQIKKDYNMEKVIKLIFHDPQTRLPADIQQRARELYNKWTEDNWGESTVVDDESAEPDALDTPAAAEQAPLLQAELPPRDHAIYGVEGIMHGVIMVRGVNGRKVYRLDPRFPKKSAKVYGHNGIPLGTWFATQLVALHRGAHGMRIGGISGNQITGAYSIIVSDSYEDLDKDRGYTIYYSGSNSHNNDNPNAPGESSGGTLALKASMRTGQPVRVLRSGGSAITAKKGCWLPDCGIRYDGLYRVVELLTPTNTKGGLYEQFKLVRDRDQTPLEELIRRSPTPQQKFDLEAFQRGS
ncbi:PUA-like domain-containing protein [Camillea tinctor]|nr:PUA-like domain-containing protein [Camillea tinctor]